MYPDCQAQVYPDGSAVLPLGRVAWKPTLVVLAPGARVPLWATFLMVTVCPLTVRVPFHEPVTVCPAGSVKVAVHPVIVEVPVLVMVSGWTTYPVAARTGQTSPSQPKISEIS